ncbi:MAG: SprT-like domain-containing protein [Lentisphaeraceae bacterium]|nr:SprT-like domain-containing protein [Lentisphaeraceae bacterium]
MLEEKVRGWSFLLQTTYEKVIKEHSLNLVPAKVFVGELPKNTLGLWCTKTRTIEISLEHLEDSPWEDVVLTLKHELAHQIVDEIYSIKEKPHGETFAKVCASLGISSEATARLDSSNGSFRNKINKLLALSTSSNEHEAALALTKAHELSCKHNISLIEQEKFSYSVMPIGLIRKKIPRFEHTIIGILTEFYFVKAIQNIRTEHGVSVGWQFEIFGDVENLKSAEYVYYFLINQGGHLWQAYRKKHGTTVNRKKRIFLTGLYDGFYRKLENERETILNKLSLVHIRDSKLDDFYHELNPHVRRRSVRQNVDPSIYNDGVSAGEKMNIRHGLAKNKKGKVAGFLKG